LGICKISRCQRMCDGQKSLKNFSQDWQDLNKGFVTNVS
jgi:hypothetical protein